MPFIGGRRAEEGQRVLVDAFLAARDEVANRLRQMHASPDWQQARIEGQTARRAETDAIKAFVGIRAVNKEVESASRYYLCITRETNRALFFVQSAVGKDFRQGLSAQQLASVAMAERIVERSLLESMTAKTFYKDAYRTAAERSPPVRRADRAVCTGKSAGNAGGRMLEDAQ
jgi:hypothetical protein